MMNSNRAFMHLRTPRQLAAPFLKQAIIVCIAAVPAGARAVNAESGTADELGTELRQLQTKANRLESFRVTFEQQVFSALRKKTSKSSGELSFAKPRKFRWEISSPNKELYVNNGEWFWKYVENTKHALRLPAQSGELEFLDVIFQLDKLSGKFRLGRLTQISGSDSAPIISCTKKQKCFSLEPLQKSAQKNIELAVDQSSGFVSTVRIDFRNGNRTLINFSEVRPAKLNADEFEFIPPAGTAVDKR